MEERLKSIEEGMKKLSEKIDSKVNNVKFVMEDEEEIVVGHAVDVKYTRKVETGIQKRRFSW